MSDGGPWRLYEETESRTAQAFEQVVSSQSFGELLARVTENVVAVTKIGTDVFDLMLRNLRLAGRQDLTRLARQLNRTEDKLELVVQELERLQDRLEEAGEEVPRAQRGARRAGAPNAVRDADRRPGDGSRSGVGAEGGTA